MLTQAPPGLRSRRPLGCVRNLVPHDRVDHLEPLPRHGFQRLAVRHAPGAAARVVVAPSVAAARKAVAREYEQVLQPLVALPRRGHRRYRRAGPPVARREPADEASLSWPEKSAMSMDMTSSDAVRGPMPGTVSRHLRGSSAANSADISQVSDLNLPRFR